MERAVNISPLKKLEATDGVRPSQHASLLCLHLGRGPQSTKVSEGKLGR